jgi:hypothetical protein
VPLACPVKPLSLVRTPLHPALQFALYELAQAIGDRPLASIARAPQRVTAELDERLHSAYTGRGN